MAGRLEQIKWDEEETQGLRFNSIASERAKVALHHAHATTFYDLFESKRVSGRRGQISYFVLDSKWQAFGEFIQIKRELRQQLEGDSQQRHVLLDEPSRFCARFDVEFECFEPAGRVLVRVGLLQLRPKWEVTLAKVESLMEEALEQLDRTRSGSR